MGVKDKLTNKQIKVMGIDKIDNGKNMHEMEKKERQRKNDNVKPEKLGKKKKKKKKKKQNTNLIHNGLLRIKHDENTV